MKTRSGQRLASVPLSARPRQVRNGIDRQGYRKRTNASTSLSEAQRTVLAVLTDRPVGATEIGRQLSLPMGSASASLYALQDRGLAVRVPGKGWRLP